MKVLRIRTLSVATVYPAGRRSPGREILCKRTSARREETLSLRSEEKICALHSARLLVRCYGCLGYLPDKRPLTVVGKEKCTTIIKTVAKGRKTLPRTR
ncbi:hypothetical protein NDU88_004019 [Pleurodeles waltl]|uniref:Uncharacterized protein n=1 Tax=Pleurodeles waltl TaxID=8319 RepID=A0AAV7TQB7_PLEWA|nr:hypothetical protein NDU88_004019 [Pleurodeles waltl]